MEGGPKLEAKFLKLGKELSSFPPENDLYAHLEEIDGLLSNVEQSPSRTMLNALQPLTKALAAKDILRHSDMDVKVVVASCISEITRITAPETPYDDDVMKEIFQLIVGSFAGLDNTSSRSYKKRVSILETVAKVRSCVVMLDLECDDLILEMFHQFVKRIRDENSESVFSCMETIMTLVIEESEDVPSELLSVLLYTLKNDKEVLPIAQHLAEHVLNNCASRIRPHLADLVRTIGAPLNEYHKVIASICQENSNVLDKQEETNDEVKASTEEGDAGFPENDAIHASISNGSVQNGNVDAVECPSSPMHSLGNEKPENFVSDDSGCDNLESNTKNSDDTEKYVQSVSKTENCPKETGFPKVNESSTTINQHSVSIGSEKKNEASVSVQAPVAELETSISLETKQQNVSNTTTVQKDPKVSQTNGNTDAVADPTTSAHVEKESCSDILRHDDATNSKNDASESSKGDNVEAPTTVKSDYASKSKQSIFKRGRKGKKGRFPKGKKYASAGKVSVQKEKGTPVKISPSNDNGFENKFGKADDIETPKNIANKSDMVSKTIGKRGRPRKEHAVEKEKDPADLILQEFVEKDRDTSVVLSPSKGDYSEKKPEVANDVKALIGKRGRPRKEHAVEKEKDPADQVLQDSVEKERYTSVVISPPKGDYSEKKPEIADDVKAQMISVKESVMASKSSGKRGRPRKKHATGKGKGPTDKALPINCDANVEESSALDNTEAPKSLNYKKSKLKSRNKRGRPKKKNAIEIENIPIDEILLSGSNTSEHMHIIKCKGSRTKVKDAVVKNNEASHEDYSLKGDKTGKAERIDDIESPNGLTNDSYITPKGKGKKGRPKKASAIEKESDLPNAALPFKSGYAEDPENSETPTKSTDPDVMSKTKGKRGRPKKELVTQESPVINKPSAKKQKGDRNILGNEVDIGSTLQQETASSLKSALKSESADKANLDSCYEPRSRRKRATNTDDIYVKNPEPKRKLDERLVGSKIKVWWPDDKEFYEGVVESYDRDTKQHRIAYADGDVEVLFLKDERWEYVGDRDMSQTKKAKTGSTSKQAKSEEQAKRFETSMAEPSSKDTPRPRGRPRKETHSQKSDVLPDNISPDSMKQPKEKSSSDEKITAIKILSKLKDVDNSPSSSGRSKAKKKGTPVSGTKLKVTFSKSQPKNETESTHLSRDP